LLYFDSACKDALQRRCDFGDRVAHEHLTYDDLLRIVELIQSTEHFSEFRLKVGEIEIELRRRRSAGMPVPIPTPETTHVEKEPRALNPAAGKTWPEGSLLIRSPMIGTFYRAPQPGAPPFVEVGQVVEPDTPVCIIEVMKLMSSISADAHGTVVQILVDDGAQVEAGQPLIALQPGSKLQ
jgi:acetyl-CoA carboxylase biotin carboxyl carrier protein